VSNAAPIRWGRISAGGLLAELAILIVALPFAFVASGERILFYVLAHWLKVIGGAAGGSRRVTTNTVAGANIS
jgi:hypothetical protein